MRTFRGSKLLQNSLGLVSDEGGNEAGGVAVGPVAMEDSKVEGETGASDAESEAEHG
jgi:hypothetical protein